jgi:hypothetical protein
MNSTYTLNLKTKNPIIISPVISYNLNAIIDEFGKANLHLT